MGRAGGASFLQKAAKLFLKAGIASAVANVACDSNDSYALAARNDYSAMVGIGADLIGIGSAMTLWGPGAGTTVVGLAPGLATVLVGGILTFAGWVTFLHLRLRPRNVRLLEGNFDVQLTAL